SRADTILWSPRNLSADRALFHSLAEAHMNSAGRFISTISAAAFAACSLFFAPAALAQPASDALGELLVGQAAFGDWRTDAPLVRRKITGLPPPSATRPRPNFLRGLPNPPPPPPKGRPAFQPRRS